MGPSVEAAWFRAPNHTRACELFFTRIANDFLLRQTGHSINENSSDIALFSFVKNLIGDHGASRLVFDPKFYKRLQKNFEDPIIEDAPLVVSGNTMIHVDLNDSLVIRMIENIQSTQIDPTAASDVSDPALTRPFHAFEVSGTQEVRLTAEAFIIFLRAMSSDPESLEKVFGRRLKAEETTDVEESSPIINSVSLVLSGLGLAGLIHSKVDQPLPYFLLGGFFLWALRDTLKHYYWKQKGSDSLIKDTYFRRPSTNALAEFNWITHFFDRVLNELLGPDANEGDFLYLALPQYSVPFGKKGESQFLQILARKTGSGSEDIQLSAVLVRRTELEARKVELIPERVSLHRLAIPGLSDVTFEEWDRQPNSMSVLAPQLYLDRQERASINRIVWLARGIASLPVFYLIYAIIRANGGFE
jgi:hypothetical protein